MNIAPLRASATAENHENKKSQHLKLSRDAVGSGPMIEWKYDHRWASFSYQNLESQNLESQRQT
jgi:hypothetical protein